MESSNNDCLSFTQTIIISPASNLVILPFDTNIEGDWLFHFSAKTKKQTTDSISSTIACLNYSIALYFELEESRKVMGLSGFQNSTPAGVALLKDMLERNDTSEYDLRLISEQSKSAK